MVTAIAVVRIAAAASVAWWLRSRPVAGIADNERPLVVVRPFTSLSPDPSRATSQRGSPTRFAANCRRWDRSGS